jgi:ribonuclease R
LSASVGNQEGKPAAKGRAGPAVAPTKATLASTPHVTPGGTSRWETAGIHCSANERRADEASRDVEAWLKCMFMRERLGEEYGGTVTAVTSFGLFVTAG